MKKVISLVMCLCLMLGTFIFVGISASAEVFGDYSYTVLDDGTVNITKYRGSETDLEVPSEIDGKKVTFIADGAFLTSKLVNVTIPDSVTSIDEDAFTVCYALKNIKVDENNNSYCDIDGVLYNKEKTELVHYPKAKDQTTYTIPYGVKVIDANSFYACRLLTDLIIPNSVTDIGMRAFYFCDSLNLTIPNSVTNIARRAFYICKSLTSVTIPEGTTIIHEEAFASCHSLTSVTIPEGVTTIDDQAFYCCESLTSVTIPKSVTSIGTRAFGYYLNNNLQYATTEGFAINGYANSAAEDYANKNGFTFNLIEEDKTEYSVKIDGVEIAKVEEGAAYTLPESAADGFVAYTDGENYMDANTEITVNADVELSTVAIGKLEMVKGASIRLGNVNGIRFQTIVDADKLAALPETAVVEKGTYIGPKDLVDFDNIKPYGEAEDYNCIDVKYAADNYHNGSTNLIAGSIVDIKDKNITRDYVGRGYVKVTLGGITKTILAKENDNTRSVAYIANAYKNDASSDYSSLDDALKAKVDAWAAAYIG